MKRTLILMLMIAMTISCQKDQDDDIIVSNYQDVAFSLSPVFTSPGLKSVKDWECKPYDPDYLEIQIDCTSYYPQVFRISGNLYTQNIRLEIPAGQTSDTFTIHKFLLWNNGGTVGDTLPQADDTIVMGVPDSSSLYAAYVSKTVDFDFVLTAFHDEEINVDVICVDDTLKMFSSNDFKIKSRKRNY